MIWMLLVRPAQTRQEIMEAISLDRDMIPQRLPCLVPTSAQDSPNYPIVLGERLLDAVERPEL